MREQAKALFVAVPENVRQDRERVPAFVMSRWFMMELASIRLSH